MVKISELPAVSSVTTDDIIPVVQGGVTSKIDVQSLITSGGFQGPQGTQGATGAQGPQGTVGATGPQGPAGSGGGIEGSISVSAFGATGDGVTDDRDAIQDAIDYALENGITVVTIPQGDYVLSDSLMLGYGYGFSTVRLIGMVEALSGAAGTELCTLRPNFVDRFVVGIQGGRGSGIENIAIIGPNPINVQGEFSTRGPNVRADINNYIPTGALTDINSPYCGVCIDPYAGSSATGDYPLVGLPSFLGQGATISYGRLNSSEGMVRRCSFKHTYIGIMNSPNDGDNGDFLDFEGCRFGYLAMGISIGTINARSSNFSNQNYAQVHTCITCTQNFVAGTRGNLVGTFDNIHCNFVYRVFQNDPSWGSPCVVTNLYCEGTHTLFDGNSLTGNGPIFIGCDVRFSAQYDPGDDWGTLEEARIEKVAGNCHFIGCSLTGGQAALFFDECTFEDCKIGPYTFAAGSVVPYEPEYTAEATASRRWGGVMMKSHYSTGITAMNSMLPRLRNTSLSVATAVLYDANDDDDTGVACWWSLGGVNQQAVTGRFYSPYVVGQLDRGTLSSNYFDINFSVAGTADGRTITYSSNTQLAAGDMQCQQRGTMVTWFCCISSTLNGGTGLYDNVLVAMNNWTFRPNDGDAANLLSFSEECDQDTFWYDTIGGTITPDVDSDPRSEMKGDAAIEGGGSYHPNGCGPVSVVPNSNYTFSREVKPGTADVLTLIVFDQRFSGSHFAYADFTLSGAGTALGHGAVGNFTATASTITAVANGYYRCSLTFTTTNTTYGGQITCSSYLGSITTPTLGATAGYYGGAQLEAGTSVGTYYEQTGTFDVLDGVFAGGTIINYYYPSSIFYTPTSDAWVVTKGSATVQYVDETGATKAIPSLTIPIVTGRSVFWYGTNSLKHIKSYLPFPPNTLVSTINSNSLTMSAVAQRSGVYSAMPGFTPNLLYM
jgi:hypothetical protein